MTIGARHWRPSAEDINAFGDARIAALHAGLKLTAEQEKNWPAVESALKDIAKQRSERFAARASADRPTDPIERMSLRADALAQRGAALKKLADAAGPLYKSLDDAQKHRFTLLARLGGERFGHWRGRGHHRGEGGWHDRGRAAPSAARSRSKRALRVAGGGRCGLRDIKPPSKKPPGSPGGFSFACSMACRTVRGWTARDCFANRPRLGGQRRQSGRIAQLVEQLTLNQRVQGSSPCAPTNQHQTLSRLTNCHSDKPSPAHSDKPPLFVLSARRMRAPARRCFIVSRA